MNIQLSQPLTNNFGDHYFEEINHQAFAKASAEDVLMPYFSSYLEEEEALYLIIGTDSGLLKKLIEERSEHRFTKFIFIEYDEVIEQLNCETDSFESIADEEKNIWLFNQDFDLHQLNRALGNYVIRRKFHLIKSFAVMDAQKLSPYEKLWEKFEVAYQGYLSGEYNSQSARVFEEQRILNVAQNLIPASTLGKPISGKDAIILGGGPTLDDSIEWIKTNQNKVIIFAAARISDRLVKEGIQADFLVTVDPFPWSFDNSKGMYAHSEHSILVHSFHAQHRLLSQWTGLSCYLGQRYAWKDAGEPLNIDGPGPTVTNTALHIAVAFGAKRVFFAGIDFCFAKGQTHESGSNEAKLPDTIAYSGKEVLEDNSGQMTETRQDFYSAKIAMETAIRMYIRMAEVEFINLGLHSAKMENVAYQQMESIQLSDDSKHSCIENIRIELVLSDEEKLSLVDEALGYLKKQKKRFEKLVKLTNQALSTNKKLYDKGDLLVEKQAKKIKQLQKKVNRVVGEDGDYFASYQSVLFSDAFKPIADENNMTNEEVQEQLAAFFGGLNAVAKAFIVNINNGIDRCEVRQKELKPKTLPCSLIQHWQQWQEPGRVYHWIKSHADMELNSEQQDCVDEAMDVFEKELGEERHAHLKMLEDALNDVSKILSRANMAYSKENVAELEEVLEHVESLEAKSINQKQDLVALLKGMVLDVRGEKVEAFNTYEGVETSILRHIALKKMLPIAVDLEDYPAALAVLERLVKINLDYMLPYADMLKVLGNLSGAIEVLRMYLKSKPEKYLTKNRLAHLLIEAGEHSEAFKLVDEVLNVDSENKAALQMREHLSQTVQ